MSSTGELSGGMGTGDTHSGRDAFGVLLLADFLFTPVARVKEETSAPHSRLACIHLKVSSPMNIGT
jgi:hypothetical protein